MELYLLRHGEAEVRKPSKKDEDRALTANGKSDIRRVAKLARAAKVKPGIILTSPLLRATQTAEIASKVLGTKRVAVTQALLPDAAPENLWKELGVMDGLEQVMLAGHDPGITRLAQFLLGVEVAIDFKKGAMIRIDTAKKTGAPKGVLKSMITPRLAGD
jgi:phosphohistidine phosphatase